MNGLASVSGGKALVVSLIDRMDNWGFGDNNFTQLFISFNKLFKGAVRAIPANVNTQDVYRLSSYSNPAICYSEGPLETPPQSFADNG